MLPKNWLMGGENLENMKREMMVVLVTPVIVDGEKLIQELSKVFNEVIWLTNWW